MADSAAWGQLITGAVIGGVITLAVTYLSDWMRAKRERRNALMNVLSEVEENLSLSDRVSLAGGHAHIRFSTDVWNVTKGEIVGLPTSLRQVILKAYSAGFLWGQSFLRGQTPFFTLFPNGRDEGCAACCASLSNALLCGFYFDELACGGRSRNRLTLFLQPL
jgi:hypothetical protein